jgi:hypothetical protein
MKQYFATVEARQQAEFNAALKAADNAATIVEHDRLPQDEVIGRYCCREPEVLFTASEKVVLLCGTTITRKAFRHLPGLVRVRTTPTYRRRHPGHTFC